MSRVTIHDTTGATWTGDDEGPGAHQGLMQQELPDWLGLDIEGTEYWFNTAHIIAIGVHE